MGLFRADSLSGLSTIVGILLLEGQLFRQGIKSKVPELDYLNIPYLWRYTMLFSARLQYFVMCCLCVHSLKYYGGESAVEIRLFAKNPTWFSGLLRNLVSF